MSRKLVFVLHLFVFLSSLLLCVRFTHVEVKAPTGYPVHNLDTGLNYTSIQGAIDAPETLSGHSISIDEGIYFETVSVDKSLNIVGEDRLSTIVNGSFSGDVFSIGSDNVTITNFTITSSLVSYIGDGIYAYRVTGLNISHNIIRNCGQGIYLRDCNNSYVTGNLLVDNTWDELSCGLRIDGGFNVSVNDNVASGNRYCGIFLLSIVNATLEGNSMTDNTYNFGVRGTSLAHYLHSIDISNTVDGKPVYYLINQRDSHINPSILPDVGYLAFVNSTNVIVEDMSLPRNRDSIVFAGTTDSIIRNVDASDTSYGIQLVFCSNISIQECFAENTMNTAIYLWGSNGCRIDRNTISVAGYGIRLRFSYDCDVTSNRIENSTTWEGYVIGSPTGIDLGHSNGYRLIANTVKNIEYIRIGSSNGTILFHNNFINVSEVRVIRSHSNVWDNGFEGNYWSNYSGVDLNHDGIGDTPHVLDANNTDRYPLMGMFSNFNATPEYNIQTICNSSVSDFQYNGTAISFNVTGEDDTTGFCRICIPKALMNDTFMVSVNGTEILPSPEPLPCSNSTHSYLYFSYEHSTKEVVIIPEFPSLIILPLFMFASLLAVLVYKRKRVKGLQNLLRF